jgi:hypothetical protein
MANAISGNAAIVSVGIRVYSTRAAAAIEELFMIESSNHNTT